MLQPGYPPKWRWVKRPKRGGNLSNLEVSNWPILGLSALDADGSRQEDNPSIANISANPMVTPIKALIINDFNVHTVGQKTGGKIQG
jgi:hypothetical protein